MYWSFLYISAKIYSKYASDIKNEFFKRYVSVVKKYNRKIFSDEIF